MLISTETFFRGEAEILTEMLNNGLQYFHLRKPNSNINDVENFMSKIPEKHHDKIIVHYHFGLYEKFNLKGVHFNSRNINEYKYIIKNDLIKGYSAHDFNEIKNVENSIDYCFISPVFNSISKQGYKAAISLNDLKHFAENNRKVKLVALGGISENNIKQLRNIGLYAVAVLGSVWNVDIKSKELILNKFFKVQNECWIVE